jgi:hypothetical protein
MSLVRTRPSLATGVVFCEALELLAARATAAAPAAIPRAAAAVAASLWSLLSLLLAAESSDVLRWLSDTDRRSPLTRLSTRRSGGVAEWSERMLPGVSGRRFSGSGVRSRVMLVLDAERLATIALVSAGVMGDCEYWRCWCWWSALLSDTTRRSDATGVVAASAAPKFRSGAGSLSSCLVARFFTNDFCGSGVLGGGEGSRSLGVCPRTLLPGSGDLLGALCFSGVS